jgi:transcriptional regulator with XRE-family HTH domain
MRFVSFSTVLESTVWRCRRKHGRRADICGQNIAGGGLAGGCRVADVYGGVRRRHTGPEIIEEARQMIVRKLRLQRGWTQEHLAEISGLSVRSIQRIERGQSFSLETLKSLAAVFEVEQSVLKSGEPSMGSDSPLNIDETSAIEYVKGIKEFYGHVLMYATFVLVFGIAFGFRFPFILWGALGWGVGLVAHGLSAYEVIDFFGPRWERRQIEKRLGRPL